MIAPNAPVAETKPQSRGPSKCAMNIGGPSTMNAARQKFEIAKPTIGARTHDRDTTSRNPSRSWRTKHERAGDGRPEDVELVPREREQRVRRLQVLRADGPRDESVRCRVEDRAAPT